MGGEQKEAFSSVVQMWRKISAVERKGQIHSQTTATAVMLATLTDFND